MKPTAKETFNLRKKMGEMYGIERADELWFGFYYKNEKIVKKLEYYKQYPQAMNYAQFERWVTELLEGKE